MKKGIISIDAESNGLYGKAFIISAVIIEFQSPWEIKDSFIGRCDIEGKIDEFVKKEVIPSCDTININYNSYKDMLVGFADFYNKYRDDYYVVTHIPYPVETNVFRDCMISGIIGEFEGPFPIYCPSSLLLSKGLDPTSVDKYYKENISDDEFAIHNPYNDAIIAGRVWIDLITD